MKLLKTFGENQYSINIDDLSIYFSLYACDYQDGDIVLFGRDDIKDMDKAGTPEIDIDLYCAAMLFDYEETERLLQKGADRQSFYNLDEKKYGAHYVTEY